MCTLNYHATVGLLIFLVGCQTFKSEVSEEENLSPLLASELQLKPETRLPEVIRPRYNRVRSHQWIKVPKGMVYVGRVIRSYAELRMGPSSEFGIKDRILRKEEEVLCFRRIGMWQQIVSPESGLSGWVHIKALSKPALNSKMIEVRPAFLPRAFAVTDIKSGFVHPTSKIVALKVEKGSSFATLRYTKRRTLVWLSSTNSPIWFNRQVVH